MNAWVDCIRNLLKFRDLLLRLAWKEIRVRYKEPILGFLWALLVPLFMTLIFMFIFTRIVKVPLKGYPFFIFLATGIFPWSFFNMAVSSSIMSVLEGGSLIKKIYFPREIIPLSIVFANAINFSLNIIIVFLFVVASGIKVSRWIALLPLAFITQLLLTSGIALLASGLQVLYRDVKFIVEIILPLWFYLSPIFYPLNLVIGSSQVLFNVYILNPFVGLLSLYRLSLLGDVYLQNLNPEINLGLILTYSIIAAITIFILGYATFKKKELIFADLVR